MQQRPDRDRFPILAAGTIICLTIGLPVCGCGPKDPRITIQGTVSLDGKPLAEGQVVFIPRNPSLGAAGGAIKDGGFTIRVYEGPHRVEINAQVEERRPVPANAPPEAGSTFRSIIPPRYNEKSTLEFDVQSAKDRPAFDLTSDK